MGCREPRRRGRSIESMRDRLRHALLIAAAVSGVAIFIAFAFYERPGLGLGHFYYVSIILAALATGPAIGAGAAGLATVLFAICVESPAGAGDLLSQCGTGFAMPC